MHAMTRNVPPHTRAGMMHYSMGSDSALDRIDAIRGLPVYDLDLAEVLGGREMRQYSRTVSRSLPPRVPARDKSDGFQAHSATEAATAPSTTRRSLASCNRNAYEVPDDEER